MPSALTFSALRPEELAKPMPTGKGLDPVWRLMKPSARRLLTVDVEESLSTDSPDDAPTDPADLLARPELKTLPPTYNQQEMTCPTT